MEFLDLRILRDIFQLYRERERERERERYVGKMKLRDLICRVEMKEGDGLSTGRMIGEKLLLFVRILQSQ